MDLEKNLIPVITKPLKHMPLETALIKHMTIGIIPWEQSILPFGDELIKCQHLPTTNSLIIKTRKMLL
jgi:hypothetical protein